MSIGNILRLCMIICSICFYESVVQSRETEDPDVGGGYRITRLRWAWLRVKNRAMEFNVMDFGAQADGQTDDSRAFQVAWKKACRSQGRTTIVVPNGTYLVGPVQFTGPCNASSIRFLAKGHLKATSDLSKYESGGGWFEFAWIDGLILTGGGTFDGQGAKAWPHNNCHKDSHCKLLPTNLKFVGMNRTIFHHITSVNSKFFHIALVNCEDFKGRKLSIKAPRTSPNTDGIHIERCSGVHISGSVIGTGDDCISIGQGNSQISVNNITCGPGHGISVGSLGRYPNEQDVKGLVVRDCRMIGTSNGIRIKTWPNSPGRSKATNLTFENIVMDNVRNPIIINQEYCPSQSCSSQVPSMVKLSDIRFKNITGTTLSDVAVRLSCSKGVPCQDIYLEDVHLNLSTGDARPVSSCENVIAKYIGTQVPAPCR